MVVAPWLIDLLRKAPERFGGAAEGAAAGYLSKMLGGYVIGKLNSSDRVCLIRRFFYSRCMAPSTIGGHMNLPFSSCSAKRHRPLPSQYNAFR